MANIYWSDVQDYCTGEWKNVPLVTRDKSMRSAFMRAYEHRFAKLPKTVTTKKVQGIKSMWAAAPSGWLIMVFEKRERKVA